jgi:hypothetical protein
MFGFALKRGLGESWKSEETALLRWSGSTVLEADHCSGKSWKIVL